MDRARLEALKRAIDEVIRPGDVVVDVGTGTGVLGILAVKAGAGRVYAIESDPVIRIARALAAENGVGDRMRFIAGDARRVRLPEKADVMVMDAVGRFGVDPHMAEVLPAIRKWLRPGGRVVPERSEVWVAPLRDPRFHRRHVRAGEYLGIATKAFQGWAASRIGYFSGWPRRTAAPLRRAFVFDFARDRSIYPRPARLRFRSPGGTMYGLAVVVRVQASPGVRMEATFGVASKPVYLPIAAPLKTARGEEIRVELNLHSASNVEWAMGDRRHCTLFEGALHA